MTLSTPAQQLSALGNDLRLACFRFVIQALGVAPSTLSSHLATLQQCGLLCRRRDRQRVIYAVDPAAVRSLVAFLLEDCCQGQPELCGVTVSGAAAEICR